MIVCRYPWQWFDFRAGLVWSFWSPGVIWLWEVYLSADSFILKQAVSCCWWECCWEYAEAQDIEGILWEKPDDQGQASFGLAGDKTRGGIYGPKSDRIWAIVFDSCYQDDSIAVDVIKDFLRQLWLTQPSCKFNQFSLIWWAQWYSDQSDHWSYQLFCGNHHWYVDWFIHSDFLQLYLQ